MKNKIRTGKRFLTQWNHDEFWYPATVLNTDKGRKASIYMRFDDGDKQWCNAKQLSAIDIEVGDRVHARWSDNDEFLPARVTKLKDEKYSLTYDDGSEKPTVLAMMRVTR